MRSLLTLALLVTVCGCSALSLQPRAVCGGSSPNRVAASPANDDVAACLRVAVDGDTISVPAGSATWTQEMTISRYVKLIAAPGVTITDNSRGGDPGAGGGPHLLTVFESAAGSVRVEGFTFVQGTGLHGGISGIIGMEYIASGQPIIIKGNTFKQGWTGNAIATHTNRGVITGNTFTATASGSNCYNNTSMLRHKPTNLGASWTTPVPWGSADTNGNQHLYFEDNTGVNNAEGIDCDDNCRIVVRYSKFTNTSVGTHGVDTSGIYGGRTMDVYQNQFIRDVTPQDSCGGLPPNMSSGLYFRGGTGLVHDNPRVDDPSSAAWGRKAAFSLLMWPPTRYGGGFPCWDTVTAPGAGYPFPHQAGWGYTTGGTTLSGTNCRNCPVRQDREPIYVWNNQGELFNNPYVQAYGNDCPQQSKPPTFWAQAGREWILGAKPGYAPFVYPHPLIAGGGPPPQAMPAPSGLTVAPPAGRR